MTTPAPTSRTARRLAASATQVRRPWRATLRTAVQVIPALAVLVPAIVDASGIDQTLPWVGGAVAISAAIARVMALPQVEDFLARWVPWLAANPPVGTVTPDA